MPLPLQSLIGIAAIPLLAWLLTENRPGLPATTALRVALTGLAAQIAIAALMLGIPQARVLFDAFAAAVGALQEATGAGMRFVFGYLAGAPAPFETSNTGNAYILAFRALPLILLMSVISRVLYHWGVLPVVIRGISYLLRRGLGISGPLGTASAAKIFVGMVEAPLLIRPYLVRLGRGELFALMTVGMATVAGTVYALYASILEPIVPGAAGHVLVASVMNVPAALTVARLMVPDGFARDDTEILAGPRLDDPPATTMEAVAQGTAEGLRLLAYVTAMLVVMVALVALANAALGLVARPLGFELTFQKILGYIAAPFAFAMGIPAQEAVSAGSLLGIKIVLNELLAYLEMAKMPAADLAPRSRVILTYALCGFANLGSLGILVGGLSAMAPERRSEIASLGMKALLAGMLATMLTGAVVGLIVWN